MTMETINPTTGERLKTFDVWNERQTEAALADAAAATAGWQATSFAERARLFRNAAAELRNNAAHYAGIITLEMGKIAREARAEVEKCALGCEFYAEHAATFLRDETIESDASASYVAYLPLGTVLAIMPWNFPFWQVFRFAAPSLMAGNTVVLKHASNVPQCALAIEEIFRKAGFPAYCARSDLGPQTEQLIADPRIHAVTLTGSDAAGESGGRRRGQPQEIRARTRRFGCLRRAARMPISTRRRPSAWPRAFSTAASPASPRNASSWWNRSPNPLSNFSGTRPTHCAWAIRHAKTRTSAPWRAPTCATSCTGR